jgi:hypothetical protein
MFKFIYIYRYLRLILVPAVINISNFEDISKKDLYFLRTHPSRHRVTTA